MHTYTGLGTLWWWSFFKILFVIVLCLVVAVGGGEEVAPAGPNQFYLLMGLFAGGC